ncbi:hypothetical protein GCM10027589_28140 [Actinocorallia lasiicapitis]
MMVRVVFAPHVPGDVRLILASRPERLRSWLSAPPAAVPRRPRFSDLRPLLKLLGVAVAGVIGSVFLSLASEALAAVLLLVSGLGMLATLLALVIVPASQAVAELGEEARSRRRLVEMYRTYHGQYRRPEDFIAGAPSELMFRAQEAVTAIERSRVNQAGLLDSVGNAVVLPAQLWEIAQTLSEVSHIFRELAETTRGIPDELREEIIAPQRAALEATCTSVLSRVEALELYARNVRAADAVYVAQAQAGQLAAQEARSRDLLAGTVRDELARADIAHLAQPATALNTALRTSLDAALEAARALSH